MDANLFAKMQRLGRALMLPIAVLPVAGLLLRLGQPDVFNIKMIADAGDTIFSNLPLLFAIGVAVGFAKDNNGTAGLAGAIGYLIEIAVMKDINDKLFRAWMDAVRRAVLHAAGLPGVDGKRIGLLGFSLGGYIAQHLTLRRPNLVRRLLLAGTGPGKGEGTQDLNQNILDAASLPPSRNGLLQLFFEQTETSKAAGAAFWDRLQTREGERDPSLTGPGVQAQRTALTRWDRNEDSAYPHLREIAQPVFVASGSHDLIIPTVNAFVLAQRLPNALLTIYPDSGHGFLFQYHTLFGKHATLFLDS